MENNPESIAQEAAHELKLSGNANVREVSSAFRGSDRIAEIFQLNRLPAKHVRAPLIAESIAVIECVLEDYIEKHGILIFKGIQLWENKGKRDTRVIHANGDGTFFADGEFRNLRNIMHKWVPDGAERF